ncbi:MAG: hydroxyisourate hydrolase [Pseudomonadota bacterium]
MGLLTTHVLDTARGRPGAGLAVRLYELGDERQLLVDTVTNVDGRTDAPLLDATSFHRGTFELEFDIAAYFGDADIELAEPPFLDTVVLRFQLAEDSHYHVPLLASPWSYTTYRGS